MRIPRVFFPSAARDQLVVGRTVALSKEQQRHVVQVLRLRDGAGLVLFPGTGPEEFRAELVRGGTAARLVQRIERHTESPLHVHLGMAISRGKKFVASVRQSVELGAASITPLLTERCGVKMDPVAAERCSKTDRYESVAESACEQCGRNVVPPVRDPVALADWLRSLGPTGSRGRELRLVLDGVMDGAVQGEGDGEDGVGAREPSECGAGFEHPALSMERAWPRATIPDPWQVQVLVGPEGGLDAAEMAAAIGAGFVRMRLGPRTMRAETAGPAATAALQALFGDFGSLASFQQPSR